MSVAEDNAQVFIFLKGIPPLFCEQDFQEVNMKLSKKNDPEKASVELEELSLDNNSWAMEDVTITIAAEGDRPEREYAGILFVSRKPINKN